MNSVASRRKRYFGVAKYVSILFSYNYLGLENDDDVCIPPRSTI